MNKMNIPMKNDLEEVNWIRMVGLVSSISLAVLTAITFVVAICTPPISGPFSTAAITSYPYTNIISRFPRDYYWMYPAMLMMLIYVVYMVSVDQYARPERKIFSHTALLFACLSAGVLFVDYFVQVSVIQPSLMSGEYDALPILTQYNPHGLFIVLEEAGYILMTISFLFMAPVFKGPGRIETGIRWLAGSSFIMAIIALVLISAIYGLGREYRFEIAVITIDFLALIMLGILSAIMFRQGGNVGKGIKNWL